MYCLSNEILPILGSGLLMHTKKRRSRSSSSRTVDQHNGWNVSTNPGASTIGQFGVVAGVIVLCGTTGWLLRELKIVETLQLLAIPVAAGLFWVQVVVILRIAEFVKAIK